MALVVLDAISRRCPNYVGGIVSRPLTPQHGDAVDAAGVDVISDPYQLAERVSWHTARTERTGTG
jgi:hypothetical protein